MEVVIVDPMDYWLQAAKGTKNNMTKVNEYKDCDNSCTSCIMLLGTDFQLVVIITVIGN